MVAFGKQGSMVFGLTQRELQVAQLASVGFTDKEIAQECGVGLTTVRTYWDRIRLKTGGLNRTHATCLVTAALNAAQQSPPEEPDSRVTKPHSRCGNK